MSGDECRPLDRVHRLPDGRALDWCEYGAADGYPVLWFHGLLSSKLEVAPVTDLLAAEQMRVIAANRPGVGTSTRGANGRTATELVHDVVHLADTLGIGRFSVVAYSGASIYALAAKAALAERISRVAIVSGSAPRAMPRRHKGAATSTVALTYAARWLPGLARTMVRRSLDLARTAPAQLAQELGRSYSAPSDHEILGGPLFAAMIDAFLQAGDQGPDGIVDDLAVIAGATMPPVARIAGGVRLWHGEDDHAVPVAQAQWLADRIPSASLTIWPKVGHLHTPDHWGEVLRGMHE